MLFLDYLISAIWLSPLIFLVTLILGKIHNSKIRKENPKQEKGKNIEN